MRFLLSEQGKLLHNLLTKYPNDWRLSDSLSKAHLLFRNSTVSLTIGYGFSSFDLCDHDSLEELTFLDKLVLWPLAKKVRANLVYAELKSLQ